MEELLKITKRKIDNHMYYGKWYYIGAIVLVLIVANIAYTVTTPRYPKENTINIMMYAGIGDEDVIDTWEAEMLEILPEDQRSVEIISTAFVEGSTETVMIARIAAADDDIFAAEKEVVDIYAQQGAFLALDEYLDFEKLSEAYPDIDWSAYMLATEEAKDNEEHIYYLPLSMVEGFDEIGFSGEDLGIAVLATSVNAENAVMCLEYLLAK